VLDEKILVHLDAEARLLQRSDAAVRVQRVGALVSRSRKRLPFETSASK